ncbi:cell division ATP-binding protein FtsE [bacterium (Candidatus Gribaldobacteria) CG08_land_8_20_14_0_20_39_15]|uniref:Cell division ATP-binding protein FtsE n=1 Tax=bacterium (Candidatus Gribaldobacteria) CG08_land_8_20_14_0_20_39_15 TaxID=2014273 RepID=A0A2M6XUV6_9BACT|nr:MAG: cell division ATP-binding protein FtsE [bacterium (Candidatus Gribaldobacteria) CG08_land_8_20_14_0_20_39_15]
MIKFDQVSKVYNSKDEPIVALKEISFTVGEGEFVCVVGKSGAGKTTLIKLLTGYERPTNGQVFFRGADVHSITPSSLQKIRRKIGVVYQDYKLLQTKTVFENLSYIMQVIGISDTDINRDIAQVLEIVKLECRACSFPQDLSGGEKQRLAIARALIHRPELIVADEPTGNLDPYYTFEIISLFKKISQMGATIILATHNKEIVDNLKKRVITLEQGRIISDDPEGRFIL